MFDETLILTADRYMNICKNDWNAFYYFIILEPDENGCSEEEFLIGAYAKLIILFRKVKTDIINDKISLNYNEVMALWDKYYNLLKYESEYANAMLGDKEE